MCSNGIGWVNFVRLAEPGWIPSEMKKEREHHLIRSTSLRLEDLPMRSVQNSKNVGKSWHSCTDFAPNSLSLSSVGFVQIPEIMRDSDRFDYDRGPALILRFGLQMAGHALQSLIPSTWSYLTGLVFVPTRQEKFEFINGWENFKPVHKVDIVSNKILKCKGRPRL